MVGWREFRAEEPELAAFAESRLSAAPAYLATVRADGSPRVHPVTLIIDDDGLYVFMEPASPKGKDLLERDRYALHNGVPDDAGSGGEVFVAGTGRLTDDAATRAAVAAAASYRPADRYLLFELEVDEVRCIGYGDIALPARQRWRHGSAGQG